ncbi:hypothetical protein I203_103233 [Kwoniella mangroviensis CBS 8507]|uniref:uncharacterized protein n=1 Tax=Kwoniella mangroviensis CBS 8507 TaxID=1296122 RepID=UPI00080CCB9E|nr:uncharacterized protein I203_05943 [Kwoniella mangroviensis CBS 8507]OCF64699.1 hypothetical protein I203_05943 [Kwoniella mangroviensis CBS 8507]
MSDVKPDITITPSDSLAGPSSAPLETIFPFLQGQDERLEISDKKNGSSVWALKIPRFLLERWEMVEEKGVELGSLMVDNSTTPAKITLRLTHPDTKLTNTEEPLRERSSYDTSGIPDEYRVNVPEERARNLYVFTEKKRVYGKGSTSVAMPEGGDEVNEGGRRKRHKAQPKLVAKVDHECQVTPVQNQTYMKILEQRRLESEQSKRPVVRMDDTGISQAEQNQLASGYRNAISTFGSRMISSAKTNNGERHARLERHELTDRIFALFKEKPYWGIPALKATLKQPDGWLREVLRDVAEQIREGKYVNMWQLKKTWRGGGDSQGKVEDTEGKGEEDVKPGVIDNEDGDENMNEVDEGEDDDDDEDDEDDFEEVLA